MKRLMVLLFLAVSLTAQPQKAGGVGDLLVAPTRIVLNERSRTAEIALINTGTVATTYRIAFRHMRMQQSGQLVEVDAPDGERLADPYLLYTPRQVTLEPRVAQTIRVRLRLPEDAEEGEYRAHLELRGLPPADMNDGATAEGQVAIRVVPIYAVSIPLLVRRGTTAASLSIDNLAVRTEGTATQAVFDLRRSGSRSTYGNVVVRFIPHGGVEEVVGAMNGISIYLPLAERRVAIPLRAPLRNGVLRVTYVDADGAAGAPPLEADLLLP